MNLRRIGVVSVCGALLTAVAVGGDLDPPGPPAPTMRTLTEVEPRFPIRAADLPLVITQSGHYYLVEDITTMGDGISADKFFAGTVTIDLNGYTLEGGTGTGINLGANSIVRNGRVINWELSGVSVGGDSMVTDLVVSGNGQSGLGSSGSRVLIQRVLASGNGAAGFSTGNSMMRDCRAENNTSHGFELGGTSTVIDSVSQSNTGSGFSASSAQVTIRESVASNNAGDGISVFLDSLVLNNLVEGNGQNGDGVGILVINDGNRIEGNHVSSNDKGIKVDGINNVIVRNSAQDNENAVNYEIVGGNQAGPIGAVAGASNPWANIEY